MYQVEAEDGEMTGIWNSACCAGHADGRRAVDEAQSDMNKQERSLDL